MKYLLPAILLLGTQTICAQSILNGDRKSVV